MPDSAARRDRRRPLLCVGERSGWRGGHLCALPGEGEKLSVLVAMVSVVSGSMVSVLSGSVILLDLPAVVAGSVASCCCCCCCLVEAAADLVEEAADGAPLRSEQPNRVRMGCSLALPFRKVSPWLGMARLGMAWRGWLGSEGVAGLGMAWRGLLGSEGVVALQLNFAIG